MLRKFLKKEMVILLVFVATGIYFLNMGNPKMNEPQLNDTDTSSRFFEKTKRSMVMGMNGVVAAENPIAANVGLDILKAGGNAIDAAVATAAMMNVVAPMNTGIGGDAFMMVYLADEKRLVGLNASGRSAYDVSLEKMLKRVPEGGNSIPNRGILSVTVPGAFDGWVTLLEKYGRMTLEDVLEPAIHNAENGFLVTEVVQREWRQNSRRLMDFPSSVSTYLPNGKVPEVGDLFINKDLAKTLRKLAKGGTNEFYNGSIAREIVKYSDENDGFLSLKDFKDHTSTWVEPISIDYKDFTLYELPPNGQGIAALEILNILKNIDMKSLGHNSAEYLHFLVEAKKLVYADLGKWVGDPDFNDLPLEEMLSEKYGKSQAQRINRDKAMKRPESGISGEGDTVYFTVMDKDHNAVSFINSLYNKFGSGMVVPGTGIVLQNRGALFSLEKGHVNAIEPHKRPFHTIIPAMAFKNGRFFMTYGIMSGSMQPQGHVQVLLNIAEFGMNIQEAIEAPRIRHFSGTTIMPEPGIADDILAKLESMGHSPHAYSFGNHGAGQAIILDWKTGGMLGGSDHRKDGSAVAY